MRAALALAGLALTLGACASGGGPTPLPPADIPIHSPDPIPGRDWHLTQHHGQSSLVFGVAESDDVDLGFTCADGSGRVILFRDSALGEPSDFHLVAGGETVHLDAEGQPSPLTDGLSLQTEIDTDTPLFRRFGELGWVTLQARGEPHNLAAHPGSEGRIARFFAACD